MELGNQQQKHGQQQNNILKYTNEQLEFIHAPKNRDIKITACAGSGKTQCVLEFTKQALKEGFNPKEICITTFNIQASNDMKKRAIELMGKFQADQIEILNFDKIITKFFKMIQKSKSQKELNKQNQKENKNQQSIELTLAEKQFQLYQDLQDESLSKHIFESYKLIIFDEFQDINQLQYEILMLFKRIGKSIIVVVGDDLQNIYEFRGSDYKFLKSQIIEDINKENKKFYGNENFNMLEYNLTTNFRCSSKITAFANDIIRSFQYINQNPMQSFEDLKCYQNKKCDIKPTLEPYKSYNDMFKDIYNFITSKVQNEGFSYSDIAIISATSFPLRQIELKLEQHNFNQPEKEIPFWSFVGKNKDFDYSFEYKGNKVTLLTAHKSKGLEWKALFFIGINDDQFPEVFIRQVGNYNQKIEEMRRLFYVGSTRAAQILKLSYFSNNNRKACRFLGAIDKNNIQFKGQTQIAQEKNTTNANQKQLLDKQVREIFEEMCNPQYIVQLQKTEKFLQEEQFYLEEIQYIHKPMFSRNQIQKIFFNQSEEILFSYIETQFSYPIMNFLIFKQLILNLTFYQQIQQNIIYK
ncbi:UvrD/REP family helicase (macronuclear) [Tetrahymena thermophila SB210]|uniref:DNA 3'-5' helicase n=1 Tax=Tetrahymena thermophila (strain SB210) TaxID=312017 RepID=Q23JB6_TETTS|nr:UvrD/REP family helicase [Tetrahymena thermophila SB210]EAR96588.3 UvrD/REP family helicase [Tetrahymena thermophila SB210]|eukprot:XP_001016833.3 UvrD/REP family helicase [Tetrahymena thermophila SB210]